MSINNKLISASPSLSRSLTVLKIRLVTDYDNNPHEFIRGELCVLSYIYKPPQADEHYSVQILPSDVDPDDIPELEDSEFWVGCIRDMRHRKVEGGDPDVRVDPPP